MPILKRKRLLQIGIGLALVAGLVYFFFFTHTGGKLLHSNMQELSEHLRSLGIYGQLLGMLLVLVQTFFPFVPFVLVAGANVVIFGIKWGFVVNYVMSCIGAVVSFYFARYYGHEWVEKRLQRFPAAMQFSRRMEKQGFFYVLIGRLIPVVPSSAINFAAGLTRMPFSQFFYGTLLGKLPIVFLESMIAHDLFHFRKYKGRLMLLVVVFILLMLAGNWVKKMLTSNRK